MALHRLTCTAPGGAYCSSAAAPKTPTTWTGSPAASSDWC